jgi:exopolyphosphatase/guanosine-5'-triphosphate,3'-diphosphate pyrophosphatase
VFYDVPSGGRAAAGIGRRTGRPGRYDVLESRRAEPETVAAVDLGSNSFHLLVARNDGSDLVVVDRLREMVRLAGGLGKNKRLTRKSQERALACLGRFGQRLRHMPADSVRAVGTNTLRTAHNAAKFLVSAEEALGHPIEIVSGIEEARLVHLGVAQSLPDPARRRLVVDIGGGSTEMIVGERFQPIAMQSLYVGCVSMSRRFFLRGRIEEQAWRKAVLSVRQELEPIQGAYRELGWEQAVGSSGTIRAVSTVVQAAGWSDDGITYSSLKRLRDAMLEAGLVKRLRLEGLSAVRRPVFPGGVAILFAVFKALGVRSMRPADGALREGLLYDLLGRIREDDVRDRSVVALADRCHVDWKQAGRVEHTVLRCLNQVADRWKLSGREPRNFIGWAARLHEIGLDVAHSHYHKHGEYIVEMSDLFGFSHQGQKLLALLVRAHRRKFPFRLFGELPEKRARSAERMAILLRLAVVLHRSRSPESIPEFSLDPGRRSLEVCFPTGWLNRHPLTRADLEQEAGYLAAGEFDLSFA